MPAIFQLHISRRFAMVLAAFAAVLVSFAAIAAAPAHDATRKPFVLVIDAGHGGRDPGCVGVSAREKDVNLAVALAFGKKVADKYGDKVKVVFTRSTDVFLTLQERAEVANSSGGDLFVSIHVNSLPEKKKGRASAQGASVYTCGLHKSESNLEVAMRENSVMELEPDHSARYHGFDPSSSESYIIFEMSQNLHQKQSLAFASMAMDRLCSQAGRENYGVRQAGFWVLWATSMPSVLVELDFMCNPLQEKFLDSDAGRRKCADALYMAFSDYYSSLTPP